MPVGQVLVRRVCERKEVELGIRGGLSAAGIKPSRLVLQGPDPATRYATLAHALVAAELAADGAGRRSMAALLDSWEEPRHDVRLLAFATGIAIMVAESFKAKIEDEAAAQAFLENCRRRVQELP